MLNRFFFLIILLISISSAFAMISDDEAINIWRIRSRSEFQSPVPKRKGVDERIVRLREMIQSFKNQLGSNPPTEVATLSTSLEGIVHVIDGQPNALSFLETTAY